MAATADQVSGGALLPPGLIVEGDLATITGAFATLCPLQPVGLDAQGLTCAPRSAPELASTALAVCTLPVRIIDRVPGWPDPPSEMIGGWYRRSLDHVPAPGGIRELVQARGEGFGPGGHATTTMCLEHIDRLPAGAAVDIGCGSGLLSQAWTSLGKGPALAVDLDPSAVDQTRRSLEAAGLSDSVEVRLTSIASLASDELTGRTLLANVPLPAHESLLARLGPHGPGAVVVSGLRPHQATEVVARYVSLGLRAALRSERDGFTAISLVRP